jgi:elongator complex protein 3
MFKEIFKNPDFQPDLLKIYPCALLKETPLYKLYLRGKYKPYSEKILLKIIKEIKKNVPIYVRIERIIRDIPAQKIVSGPVKISNLREVVQKEIKGEKWSCKCIRCREVKDKYDLKEKLYLYRKDYEASEGKEIFLTFENKKRDKLYSLLRLRISSNKTLFPVLKNSAIIREVHTYGQMVPISEKRLAPQHRGLGKKLIKTAEKIAKKEFKISKIAVISAVGAREYYRKFGYKLKEGYMVRKVLLSKNR